MRVSFIERGIMAYSSIGYNYKSKLFLCQKTVHNIEYRRMRNDSHMENEVVNGKPLFQQFTLKSPFRCSGTSPKISLKPPLRYSKVSSTWTSY